MDYQWNVSIIYVATARPQINIMTVALLITLLLGARPRMGSLSSS